MLEEGVRDHRLQRMTMQALPGSALEVIETEFFFQLLVSLLANPSCLDGGRGIPQAADRRRSHHGLARRATANRLLTYLKATLNHAWRAGLVPPDDAWRRVKPFRFIDAPVIRYLSHGEITRLLKACQGALCDLVHAAR
jgi:hypothetical protein